LKKECQKRKEEKACIARIRDRGELLEGGKLRG